MHKFHQQKRVCSLRTVWFVFFCICLQGCATPSAKLNDYASGQGFERSTLRVKGFKLLVYKNTESFARKKSSVTSATEILHVYLEGDGSPWRYRTVVMPDPTPRNPLMLRLMALDEQESVYIGRPCYNGTSADPGCESRLWTSGRYSNQVVESMAAAIDVLSKRLKPDEIRLFGHSGGGALALLLAEKLPLVTHVVTIAGNLDTDAWTDHHGYTPLFSSLNPAKQPTLRQQVKQWHLVGGRDTVIPVQIVKPFVSSQVAASGFLYQGYDHGCCWVNLWPTVLSALRTRSSRPMLGSQFKTAASHAGSGDSQ